MIKSLTAPHKYVTCIIELSRELPLYKECSDWFSCYLANAVTTSYRILNILHNLEFSQAYSYLCIKMLKKGEAFSSCKLNVAHELVKKHSRHLFSLRIFNCIIVIKHTQTRKYGEKSSPKNNWKLRTLQKEGDCGLFEGKIKGSDKESCEVEVTG